MTRRRGLSGVIAATGALAGPLSITTEAAADHPGPLYSAPMSPAMVALLSGGLALVAGIVIVIIIMLLTRKDSSSE